MRLGHVAPLLVVWLFLASSMVDAQPPAPRPPARQSTPSFSPYLNLLRGGNPAINYYGLVRPELEFRGAIRQLQQQVETIPGQGLPAAAGQLPPTGHPVQFMNLSHYYPSASRPGTPAPRR
jgi:hypothetical protein